MLTDSGINMHDFMHPLKMLYKNNLRYNLLFPFCITHDRNLHSSIYVAKGGFFAETYALLENEPLLVDVRANENCRILFFKVGSLKKLKSNLNLWSFKLISNLLMISANKNLHLSGRSFHTSPKTIRGRVMAYLNSVSLKKGSNEFAIPFDRQQLADYLNLERSALSKELGKMKKDGLIEVWKNHFKLMS